MSLKSKLSGRSREANGNEVLFQKYGILKNPYPPAGQPSGHPHMPGPADEEVEDAIKSFVEDKCSQAILVEGTQGAGKTNLLGHFESELSDVFREDHSVYIVRYFPDPEPSFAAIIRQILQALGPGFLTRLGKTLAKSQDYEAVIEQARSHEARLLLQNLRRAAKEKPDAEYTQMCELAHQWFLGLRVLKLHQETLGVKFRLDTVESLTQAVRDLVSVGAGLDLVSGIFLLLDELEKQDYSASKTVVLRLDMPTQK